MFEDNAVAVVDCSRTPFFEATGLTGANCAADLAVGDESRVAVR